MKKLLLYMIIGMFLISCVSAYEFDNMKFEKIVTFDGKQILGNTLLEKYKPIEIKNAFGLGETLFEGYLSQHDKTCGIDCKSTIKINLHKDGVLIDDIIFNTHQKNDSWIKESVRSYQFSYWGDINDYKYQCIVTNDTKELKCSNIKIGTHQGQINYHIGDKMNAGIYTLTLNAKKKPSRTIDWVIKTNGEWLNSWATWGNISEGDDAQVTLNTPLDNVSSLIPVVTFNASVEISGGATLTNMSLYTNQSGVWEIKNTTNLVITKSDIRHTLTTDSGWTSQVTVNGYGVKILVDDKDINITSILKIPSSTATQVQICINASQTNCAIGDQIAIASFVGNLATFSPAVTLNASEAYNFHLGNGGASYTRQWKIGAYPVIGSYFNFISTTADGTGDYTNVLSINATLLTLVTNSIQIWNRTINSSTLWNVQVCDSDGDCGFAPNNYTLRIDDTAPTINITYPEAIIDYGVVGQNETFNWTAIDLNLDTCWYNYNGTNVTVTCGDNTTEFILVEGFTNLTFYANDSVGNENSTLINWVYKVFENSRTSNTTTYETAYEGYSINLTANSSLSAVSLFYNGTYHTTTKSGTLWSYSRDLPSSVLGIQNFKYRFTYAGDYINSTESNQTVNQTLFGLCNSTITNDFLNLTFKDESDLSSINATIPTSTFEYYLGSGTVTKSYQLVNNTNNTHYGFCATPTTRILHVDPYVQYVTDSYPQRIWDLHITDYNSTVTNQVLYLLSSIDGIYVTFQVINSADQTISGVSIDANREISGSDTIVGQGVTGDDGTVTFWLNPDFSHDFTFTKDGFETYETTFTPTQTSYTITMSGGGTTVPDDYTRGILTYIYPTQNELFNGNAYDFEFNVTSSFWDLDSFGFNLRLANGTIVDSDSSTVSGTAASVNYNVGNQTIIYMDYYWIINGNTTSSTKYWIITNTAYSGWSIKTFFTDLTLYLDSGLFGIDNFGRLVIIFLILFMSVGIMSYKFGMISPMAVTSMIFAIIFFFDVVVGLIPEIRGINYILTYLAGLTLMLAIFNEVSR